MRERPSRAWSFFKKGAAYPRIRVIKIKGINTQQLSRSRPSGGLRVLWVSTFSFPQRGLAGTKQNKNT